MNRPTVVLLTALTLCLTLGAMAQDKAEPAAKPAPAMDPKQQAAMEAMEKAAQPGPNHALLAQMAGTWDVTIKVLMGPGEPQVSKGQALRKMILGGRFLEETYKGTYMDKPFYGLGITGFDNVTKKFNLYWVDSMGTTAMFGQGDLDPSGKVLTSVMTFTDPATGKPATMRQAMNLASKDLETLEMYGPGPDGKEVKMMELTYKRAAHGKGG